MAKKKKTGGRKRMNPSDKAVLVGFYTKKSIVDSVGGMDSARELAKIHIEARAEADDIGRMAMHG